MHLIIWNGSFEQELQGKHSSIVHNVIVQCQQEEIKWRVVGGVWEKRKSSCSLWVVVQGKAHLSRKSR